MYLCDTHRQEIKYICQSPQCSSYNFSPLCEQCLPEHDKQHNQQNYPYQNSPQEKLLSFQMIKNSIVDSLENAKEKLQTGVDECNRILSNDQDYLLEGIYKEIEGIKRIMNNILEEFKEKVRMILKRKVKVVEDEMMYLQEDLKQSKEFCSSYNINSLSIEQIAQINKMDLDYQCAYKLQKIDEIDLKKKTLILDTTIIKELKAKLFSDFRNNLNSIIKLNGPDVIGSSSFNNYMRVQKTFHQMNPFEIIEDQISTEQVQSLFTNWLFYFQPETKKFIYIDLEQKKHQFETLQLKNDFEIPYYHQSLLGTDGNIYLVGGYINTAGNKQIYQLDFHNEKLVQVGQMLTPRWDFGACCCGDYLYFIGGFNNKEGSLIKCEKFHIPSQMSCTINFLNIKSCGHNVCEFRQNFLFKLGGIQEYQFQEYQWEPRMLSTLFERYVISDDFWEIWRLNDINSVGPQINYRMGCSMLNENNFIVFGGKNSDKYLADTFLINIKNKNANVLEASLNQLTSKIQSFGQNNNENDENSFTFIEKNQKILSIPAYFQDQAVIIGKQMYILAHTNKEIKVLQYDQNGWKTYY